MMIKEKKAAVAEPFKTHKTDSGSTAVQIAVLTARINDITKHMETSPKDYASRIGLLKLVGQRRQLLNYLSRHDDKQYKHVLSELKLRK
jgi:small subunit ribosomal protein S15